MRAVAGVWGLRGPGPSTGLLQRSLTEACSPRPSAHGVGVSVSWPLLEASVHSSRARGPRVTRDAWSPLGSSPVRPKEGRSWMRGSHRRVHCCTRPCLAALRPGPHCRAPSRAGSPRGRHSAVRTEAPGLSPRPPRLCRSCWLGQRGPPSPQSCGIPWGLLGLGQDHGRVWAQVSCPSATGAHVLLSPRQVWRTTGRPGTW